MKKNKIPNLVSILILTLITSIFWISLSVYRAFTIKPAESVPEEISNPIDLSWNQSAIDKVETKVFLDSSQIPQNVAVPSSLSIPSLPIQTSLPIPTQEATPSSVPSATP